MSNIAVEKVREPDTTPAKLFEKMRSIAEKIRQRAFDVFERRGGADGRSLDDWLQAEREVLQSPESELIEKDGKFRVRMVVSGFDPKEIHVTAMPSALIVQAEAHHEHEKHEGNVHFCEFGQKELFRRVDLPAPINPDKVTATLEHGMLLLTAEKAVDSANKTKVIAAA